MKELTQEERRVVGGKAYHLCALRNAGLPVPDFAVFGCDLFEQEEAQAFLREMDGRLQAGVEPLADLAERLQNWARDRFREEDLSAIEAWLAVQEDLGQGVFAVRSSATVEDGNESSFAGQFETCLHISKDEVGGALEAVLLSLYSEAALAYLQKQGLGLLQARMVCVVQIMVQGDVSGIYFTANPKGILNEHVIVAGYGLGDAIVEDRVPVTTVTLHPQDQLFYAEESEGSPSVSRGQLDALEGLAARVMERFGPSMDMEFTFVGERLYLLQARPITTLPEEPEVILDNSNIVESYPGVSTPLTISFVHMAYRDIFKSLATRLLGGRKEDLEPYEAVFDHMVAPLNGRLYYQIDSWYQLLHLLPFSKRIIPIWQDMLGVRERAVPKPILPLSLWQRLGISARMLRLFWKTPRLMADLERRYQAVEERFAAVYGESATSQDLVALFWDLHDQVLEDWDLTLVNDLYAFVFTGLLKKVSKRPQVSEEISGIADIESMKPARALAGLVSDLRESPELVDRLEMDGVAFLETDHAFASKVGDFIERYGDRAPEELKLETETFRTRPEKLLDLLLAQARAGAAGAAESGDAVGIARIFEDDESGGARIFEDESNVGRLNLIERWLATRAQIGVANRESSRLNRTRIYGMVRAIFRRLGQDLVSAGQIDQLEDVFYLSKEEVFAALESGMNLRDQVAQARQKETLDRELPTFSRFVFRGQPFEKSLAPSGLVRDSLFEAGQLQGMGCSAGRVRAQALVVDDVQQVESPQGKIIVTRMTDPGWVYLLTQAAGIIAEQGSLLSHTAIISRELGIPSVVHVVGATHLIQTGDWLELDGLTGQIIKIDSKSDINKEEA